MAKKRELTEKELEDFFKWDEYCISCVKILKDDRDEGLDSYFVFSALVYIRPDKEPKNIYMKEVVNLFKGIKKERTLSHNEMPVLFKSFYFDEVNIEKFDEPTTEDITDYFDIFQKNYEKGYPVLIELEMEMNSEGNQYREDTKTRKYLVNYFGIQDLRFKHFLDSLSLLNELMPMQLMPRSEVIFFFNELEKLKNYIFDFKNPDFKDSIKTVSIDNGKMNHGIENIEKYRYKIPFKNVKIRPDISKNIEKILQTRNSLWKIVRPYMTTSVAKQFYYERKFANPFLDFLSQLLPEYDYELSRRQITSHCMCCGGMFRYKKGKRFCSVISEGKDCGKKFRNYRDYSKHRDNRKLKSKKYMSSYRKLLKKHGIINK